MEKQIKVLNASDFKFTEFTEYMELINPKYNSNNWFVKLREIDAKIHNDGAQDRVTLADDRIIYVIFKVMAETNMFSSGEREAGIKEWFVVKRYLEIYAEKDIPNLEDLKRFVTLHLAMLNGEQIPIRYAGGSVEAKHAEKEYKQLGETLNGIEYDFLPIFVLDAFAGTAPEAQQEPTEIEWLENAMRVCEIMIEQDPEIEMSDEVMLMWVNKYQEVTEKYNALKK